MPTQPINPLRAAWEQGKNDIANCSGAALRIDIRTADERITIRGEKKEQEEKEEKGYDTRERL